MRYLGSKTLLVKQINDLIGAHKPGEIFCDPFGGIGTVGSYMKQCGYRVISGDLLLFAHCFQKSLIQLDEVPAFSCIDDEVGGDVERYLNTVSAEEGWLIQEYCNKRKFFTEDNAKCIQGCIDAIWTWKESQKISEDEYAILIASLIQSVDKVANTAGTYYAYLKEYYRKARQPFCFQLLRPTKSEYPCQCFLEDANALVSRHACHVLYLDPPYNTRDYFKYYHLPETIAKGEVPSPIGKSGISHRQEIRSPYIIKSKAEDAFVDLIEHSRCDIILFHYTDNGLLDESFVRSVLSKAGTVKEYYFDCKGYRTSKSTENHSSQHHVYKVEL